MNKLANFILSTTAKMTAICSIAVVACLFVTIQVNDYLKWTTENLTYQSWVASDALNICKLAEEKCVAEIALTRSDKPFWENIPVKDDCIRIEIGKTICKMNEPVDFSNSPTAKRRMMIDLGIVFLVPFIFVYALKSFFYIKHIGWRRIILTTACCITVITYYYYNKTHYTIDELELTIYTLLAFLISISIPFFIFHFVNWIKEGFLDKNEVREKSK